MWRDVHRCVASVYSDAFRSLETDGLVDPLNEVDLFCIRFICVPRIDVQSNPSIMATIGERHFGLYRGVALYQGFLPVSLYKMCLCSPAYINDVIRAIQIGSIHVIVD